MGMLDISRNMYVIKSGNNFLKQTLAKDFSRAHSRSSILAFRSEKLARKHIRFMEQNKSLELQSTLIDIEYDKVYGIDCSKPSLVIEKTSLRRLRELCSSGLFSFAIIKDGRYDDENHATLDAEIKYVRVSIEQARNIFEKAFTKSFDMV